jgi:hypothetical protein
MFPHPPRRPSPLFGRHFREGVSKILIDQAAPQWNHIHRQPRKAARKPRACLDSHCLQNADEQADRQIGAKVAESNERFPHNDRP